MIDPKIWDKISEFEDQLIAKGKTCAHDIEHYRREMSLAVFMEVAELVDSFQWKTWKDGNAVDKENATREIVDILFFLHHVARSLGIIVDDINTMFDRVLANDIHRHIKGGDDQFG